jgi:GNAT superfamily N-acetyltransferase
VDVEVRPATSDRWSDVVAVFGRRGRDASWCWCQLFLNSPGTQPTPSSELVSNRDALREEIANAEVPPGLIAYVDGRPVGWTRIGPRSQFPGVKGNRALARVLTDDDPDDVWWVTCFAVESRVRRSGVGRALLEAAVEFASQNGASAVEGHPVDVAALKARKISGSAIYTGTRAMFEAASFAEVAHTAPTRPVMRRTVRTETKSGR